jgi:hypothetical protein
VGTVAMNTPNSVTLAEAAEVFLNRYQKATTKIAYQKVSLLPPFRLVVLAQVIYLSSFPDVSQDSFSPFGCLAIVTTQSIVNDVCKGCAAFFCGQYQIDQLGIVFIDTDLTCHTLLFPWHKFTTLKIP